MPRRLKTYQTSIGFFDLAIAAPSMKAAAEAWGSDTDVFKKGFAKETDDPKIVAATMAKPGVILKRPVGRMAASAKMPSYRRSIRSRKTPQSLNPRKKNRRRTGLMTKLPKMPQSPSRGSRSGVSSPIGRKRPRERRSVSGENKQLQKPKELLRKPVRSTKPRSKRLKMPALRLINDIRLRTLVGRSRKRSRKRNWRQHCAGRAIRAILFLG